MSQQNPCGDCGQCCRNQHYPPFMDIFPHFGGDDHPTDPELRAELQGLIHADARTDDMPCVWLMPDNSCRHYSQRPQICRDFNFAGESCNHQRTSIGLNPFPFVPVAELEDKALEMTSP